MKICSLASGSSGNSVYIEGEESKILIDAGLSGKAIVEKLNSISVNPKELKGIFITHEHIDHIKGVGVLSRKFDLPVYATERAWEGLSSLGKIAEANICYLTTGSEVDFDDIKVEPFSISHDATDPIGFSFHGKKEKLGFATDTGCIDSEIKKHLSNCDMLFLEANYDDKMLEYGPYPKYLKNRIASRKGHLSNLAAAEVLSELISGQTKEVMLAHLSQENNLPKLAYHTIKEKLEEIQLKVDRDLKLDVAPRSNVSNTIEF